MWPMAFSGTMAGLSRTPSFNLREPGTIPDPKLALF
jgi:hypothetical protein